MNRSIYRIAVISVLVGLLASCAKTGELASPPQPEKDIKEKTLTEKEKSKDDPKKADADEPKDDAKDKEGKADTDQSKPKDDAKDKEGKADTDQSKPKDDTKDKERDEEKADEKESPLLKLNLDLTAEIKQAETGTVKYNLGAKNAAVALIRSIGIGSGDHDVIYLPMTLTRSDDDPQKAVAVGVSVPMDKIKADPNKKWEIRLIVGGVWNPDTKQLHFGATEPIVSSEKKSSLHISQPYYSAWVALPTDTNGEFAVSNGDKTAITLSLRPQGTVLSHHIGTCDTPSDVVIRRIKIEADAMTFDGYYDLSDPQVVGEMKTDEAFGWHSSSSSAHSVALNFKTPYSLKNGSELNHHYLYVWAMSDDSATKHISVFASGKTTGSDSKDFNDMMIFDEAVSTTLSGLTEINSTLHIEKPKVEGPIILSTIDGKSSIVADGKEVITFKVMQSGNDITSECEIFRRDGLLERPVKQHQFSTERTGKYEFYASRGGKRSNTITVTATQKKEKDTNGNVTSGALFCPHVTKAGGWYDINKVGDGNSPQDGLLCWAATASNMLEWWLHDFEGKGYRLPASVPHGKGKRYALAIFDTFFEDWVNYMHSSEPAIRWFLEGGGMRHASSNGSSPTKKGSVSEGGYLKGVIPQDAADAYFNSKYVQEYGAYYQWETAAHKERGATIHERFTNVLTSILKEGPSGLAIDSHEMTVWGCELTNGLVTKVYLTNSDDGSTRLTSYDVIEKDGRMHLKDYIGKTQFPTQIIRLTGLKGYHL